MKNLFYIFITEEFSFLPIKWKELQANEVKVLFLSFHGHLSKAKHTISDLKSTSKSDFLLELITFVKTIAN